MPIPWAALPSLAARGYGAFVAANAVREQFCDFYAANPQMVNGALGILPGGDFFDPILPIVCPNVPPPNLPFEPPFNGGQCCGLYEVTYAGVLEGQTVGGTFGAPGKIGGLYWEDRSTGQGEISGAWILEYGLDCPGVTPVRTVVIGGQALTSVPSCSIVNITRVDGLPDDCGNPNPQFPFPPVPLPLPDFQVNIPIGNINVPITFQLQFNAPPININFAPTLNFSSPIGDINFTPDGINISLPGVPADPDGNPDPPPGFPFPDPRLPGNRPPVFNPPRTPGGGGGGGGDGDGGGGGDCPDVNLRPVLDALQVIKTEIDELEEDIELLLDCDRCDRPQPGLCRKSLVGSGNSASFPLGSLVEWVGVEVIDQPEIPHGYLVDNSADVLLCGWHEFGGGGCNGVRTPIQYEKNVYPKVEGCSTFSFGLRVGYSANYYIYERIEQEEDS